MSCYLDISKLGILFSWFPSKKGWKCIFKRFYFSTLYICTSIFSSTFCTDLYHIFSSIKFELNCLKFDFVKGFERLRNWVVFRIVVSEVEKKNLEFLVVVVVASLCARIWRLLVGFVLSPFRSVCLREWVAFRVVVCEV